MFHPYKKCFHLLFFASLTNLHCKAEPAEDLLYKKNVTAIYNFITNEENSENFALTYYYIGPFGWSKPAIRVVISEPWKEGIFLTELNEHHRITAGEMAAAKEENIDKWFQMHAKHWISTTKSKCPDAVIAASEVIKMIKQEIISSQYTIKAKTDSPFKVLVDGGHVHRVIIGNNETLSSLTYSIFGGSNAAISAIPKLMKSIIACKDT